MNSLFLFALLSLECFIVSSLSQRCTLPDIQRTEGECMHLRDCRYQLGRLTFGSNVTSCSSPASVCCPKTESFSQKKCSEWRELLHVPLSFSLPRREEQWCPFKGNLRYRRWSTFGNEANPFEHPHIAALGYGSDPDKLKFLCGATLISERFLITAASCVTNGSIPGIPSHAMLGDIILDPSKDRLTTSPYRKVIKIRSVFVHPNYKPPLIYNDIALVLLSTSVELSRYLLPACIGTPLVTPRKDGIPVESLGWGIADTNASNVLQMAKMNISTRFACNRTHYKQPERMFSYPEGILRSLICGYDARYRKDFCHGDTGSGLFYRESQQCEVHIVGVMSTINPNMCEVDSQPTIYTAVASFQDWIESIVWGL